MSNYAKIYQRLLANERLRPARLECPKALRHGEALVGVIVLPAKVSHPSIPCRGYPIVVVGRKIGHFGGHFLPTKYLFDLGFSNDAHSLYQM
jgi:hypothetical protein